MGSRYFRLSLLICFYVLVAINFIFASWYVLHKDIAFSSDIARDFFLLKELGVKKIVLIGPSSSTGLFHGPLWTYLNFPAYFLGNGNPVIVGWWWVFLTLIFVISNYFIAKKLFNKATAYLFVLMTSLYMSFHTKGMFNPHGAMFLIPSFFFFFIRYQETLQKKYLVLNIIIGSLMIQFQMAIGIPFMILSFLWILILSFRQKQFFRPLFFLITFFFLGNFVLFDIRHQFLITHLLIHFVLSPERSHPTLISLFMDRINLMFTSVEFFRVDPGGRNLIVFILLAIFLAVQVLQNKFRLIYFSFIYFYVGFYVLSFVNVGGTLLYFYLFPLFPLLFLIFCSFITSRYRTIFLLIFILLYVMNIRSAMLDLKEQRTISGKSLYSWEFLNDASREIFNSPDHTFGYFVYSPNTLAYEGKYAMDYNSRISNKESHYFTKEPVTYLFIAPPPQNNPYMRDSWWTHNRVNIKKNPVSTIKFSNGYKIEKYELTPKEIAIPFDPGIDPGLTFR